MRLDVKDWELFLLPWYPTLAVLLRHAFDKVYGHLGVEQALILPPSSPLSSNIHHGQMQNFQQAVVCGKDEFGLGYLAQLAVEVLNGVGGVDQPANLLRYLKQVLSFAQLDRQDWEIFGYFLSQCSPKVSRASRLMPMAMYPAFFTICPLLRTW